MLRTSFGLWILCIWALTATRYSCAAYGDEPSPYDRLHDAIKRGDLDEVEWLVERFPGAVNECPDQSRFKRRDPELTTALAKAIQTDDQRMVRLLLKYGAEVNREREAAPLYLVKSAGVAQILIDAGANVNGRSRSPNGRSTGNTPLHYAPNVAIAKTLLAAGAELNCRNSEGETPLSTAIQEGPNDLVEFLFQKGAKIASGDVGALTSACRQGDLEVARKLLDQGIKIESGDEFGNDPLQAACKSGNPKVVELLLKRGANPSARSRDNPSLAFFAAEMPLDLEAEHHDHAGVLKVLKDAGTKFDLRTGTGNTLLHLAASVGNTETTRYLLSCGVEVNAKNKEGQTPLHLAAMARGESYGLHGDSKHHAAVAELLLRHGADAKSEVKITEEVLVLAKDGQSFEYKEVTEVFTPLRYAARRTKWSDTSGEVDVGWSEPTSGLRLMFTAGATAESNARRAKDVENGNRAREAVGEVLKRFGAE